MEKIFPPAGDQDQERLGRIQNSQEREYLWFCLEFCDQVLERRPVHPEALEVAANHFTDMGYYADGLRLDERLASLNPDNPGILYNLSCSLALTGRREEALRQLSAAVDKGYGDHRHMAADPDLASIRDDMRFAALLTRITDSGGSDA